MLLSLESLCANIHKYRRGEALVEVSRLLRWRPLKVLMRMKPKRLKSAPEDENTPPGPAVAVWGKKKSAFRCKRGVFSKILRELPEEIEYEVRRTQRHFFYIATYRWVARKIFSHLDSGSFLNLAMSCKFLWKKYTAPEKSRFWVRCRQNAGLPDCPPHLTERAFAHLVYMKCCHVCLPQNLCNPAPTNLVVVPAMWQT